jgi:hypothetical protein
VGAVQQPPLPSARCGTAVALCAAHDRASTCAPVTPCLPVRHFSCCCCCYCCCWSCPQVWSLRVDVHVLDAGGNLVDACCLAALAALLGFRKPVVEVDAAAGEGEEAVTVYAPEARLRVVGTPCRKGIEGGTVALSALPRATCYAVCYATTTHTPCHAMPHWNCCNHNTTLRCHVPQVREPQPLTMHHLPLSHTFAVFEVRSLLLMLHSAQCSTYRPLLCSACTHLSPLYLHTVQGSALNGFQGLCSSIHTCIHVHAYIYIHILHAY